MSALHLSENDVYNRTTGQAFPQRQNTSDASEWDDRLGKCTHGNGYTKKKKESLDGGGGVHDLICLLAWQYNRT